MRWARSGKAATRARIPCSPAAIGSSLEIAAANGIRSIAFPAISTGVYGYPLERATGIAIAAVREGLARHPEIERVVFCCFGAEPAALYRRLLSE